MTRAILENARASELEITPGCTIQDSPACDKWIKFVNNGPRTGQTEPWLSSARTLPNQPYSAPSTCDVDARIEMAESQTAETQDEL